MTSIRSSKLGIFLAFLSATKDDVGEVSGEKRTTGHSGLEEHTAKTRTPPPEGS